MEPISRESGVYLSHHSSAEKGEGRVIRNCTMLFNLDTMGLLHFRCYFTEVTLEIPTRYAYDNTLFSCATQTPYRVGFQTR